ncbi:MAG TPA: hypothetical protein VMT10_00720 [Solirubrobacteraceae bacterium]|nr:hypothetical protein [Solirubrobacteraceae bacterium]
MRIAIDIDSTLHHYWDQFSAVALRRFGIVLPYEGQITWGITKLEPEQVRACVLETHTDELIATAEPYPGAVEAINRWHDAGHFIHITSHRSQEAHAATERWLRAIGLAHDDLYCSFDKISRCREIEIDVLIDDSPVNLQDALDHGIAGATIVHPWNRELCDRGAVISAADWPELETALAPLLAVGAQAPHLPD